MSYQSNSSVPGVVGATAPNFPVGSNKGFYEPFAFEMPQKGRVVLGVFDPFPEGYWLLTRHDFTFAW
jgi:hypothetical protein